MSKKIKIKILDIKYDKEVNLVQWKILDLEDKKERILAWRGTDLGVALGIANYISPDLMEKFCKDMIGKEINLVIEHDKRDLYDPEIIKNTNEVDMQNMMNDWEKSFPFYEIEYLEKKEKKKNEEN